MGIVKKDSIKITFISYIGAAIGYLNKILLFPNFLSPEQVGLTNILVSIAAIYAQFSAMGMVNVTLRFFPFYRNKAKSHNGFLFWTALIVSIGFTVLTFFFLLFDDQIVEFYSKRSELLVQYYLYLIPLGFATLFYSLFDNYLRSLYKTVIPTVVYDIGLRSLVTVSILLYAFNVVNFHYFVLIYIFFHCIPVLVLLVYVGFLKQLFIKPVAAQTSRRLRRIIFNYGLISFISNMSNVLLANIDALMIAGMVSLHQTGIFTTVAFISTIMLIPYRALLKVSSPLVADYWKTRNMTKMQELYTKVSLVNLIIGIFFFIILWVNLHNIFGFMPKEYSGGRMVFLFLSIGRLFDMASGLNGVILVTSKKYRYDLIFTVLLILLAIFSNIYFIPKYGMNGAAIATFITLISYNLMRLAFVRLAYKIQPFTLRFLWIVLIGSGTIFLIDQINYMYNIYIDLLVRIGLCVFLFVLPVLLFKWSSDVNNFVKEFLPKLRLGFLNKYL